MGVAMNFIIDGKERLIPMVVEEASIVAAASNAAKMARPSGGFHTSYTGNIMIAQVQVLDVPNPHFACQSILHHKEEILSIANSKDPILVKYTGGAKDVEVRVIDSIIGTMVVVHLIVDTGDAMGLMPLIPWQKLLLQLLKKLLKEQ